MPEKLHKSLEKRAKELGLKDERKNAYIYGTMAKVEKKKTSVKK